MVRPADQWRPIPLSRMVKHNGGALRVETVCARYSQEGGKNLDDLGRPLRKILMRRHICAPGTP
jgi:hypothetical protein